MNEPHCDRCPIPELCLRKPIYCEWARDKPADSVEVRTIVNRSRMAAGAAPVAYPSLPAQAANLSRALWDWAVSGFVMATEEERARRLSICHACPQWDDGRCRICGCQLQAKVSMKTGHCPISKW